MNKSKKDLNLINSYPTKNLFISMLTKDLTLRDAIGDLVDNSVDGARTLAADDNYKGLRVDIISTPEKFKISDNCGGISVDIARNYAFCFGRPEGFPETPGSIGSVGIGMKRALFKLGNFFNIISVSENSKFEMEEKVDQWKIREDWDFKFKHRVENQKFSRNELGTIIEVTELKDDAISQFSDNNFLKKLRNEIELEHLYAIHKGLIITLNKIQLNQRHLDFIKTDKIKPGYWKQNYANNNLSVKVFTGISKDIGPEGGWYIFCNNRLIIGPDTTIVTGWTGRKGDGVAEYHDQFHRFRGYVFFEAKNSDLLPWNTTKTSMDLDSPVYKAVRLQMIEMMKPVMTLMNYLKKENEVDTPEDKKLYNNLVNNSQVVSLSEIVENVNQLSDKFIYPPSEPRKKEDSKGLRILYYKPAEEVNKVKQYLGTKSNTEVGEYTFNYFYESEIE